MRNGQGASWTGLGRFLRDQRLLVSVGIEPTGQLGRRAEVQQRLGKLFELLDR